MNNSEREKAEPHALAPYAEGSATREKKQYHIAFGCLAPDIIRPVTFCLHHHCDAAEPFNSKLEEAEPHSPRLASCVLVQRIVLNLLLASVKHCITLYTMLRAHSKAEKKHNHIVSGWPRVFFSFSRSEHRLGQHDCFVVRLHFCSQCSVLSSGLQKGINYVCIT